MYCVMCGAENPEYGRYCHKCGKPLLVSQPHDQQDSKPVAQPPPAPAVGPKPAIPPMEYSPAQPGTAAAVADRLEIKPKTGRNVLLLVLGCSFFTIAGLYMMSTGEPQNVGAGLLSVVFFGGGGLIMGPRLLRRKVSMVLTREGMEQITPYGKAYIGWHDVEKLGLVSIYANKMVGIRLLNYDAYVQSMSPEMTEFIRKNLPYMKLLARGTSLLSVPDACALWSKLEGNPDPKDALKSFGKVGSFVETLIWNRQQYGYDVLLAWQDRDRSAPALLDLLQAYRGLA